MRKSLFRLIWILNILFSQEVFIAQDTLKVTYYNLLNFPSQQQDRVDTLKKILDFIKPDIFLVNELTSFNGAMLIKNNALNSNGFNTYQSALFYDGPDTDNLLFYNHSKFGLYSQNQISTTLRDISEYVLYYKDPNLVTSNDTTFVTFYSLHLKAGNSSTSEERRNQDAVIFKQYLIENGITKNIFVGGDFNFYNSTELGCQEILYGQGLELLDPLDKIGNWHTNSDYIDCHTQSTRLNTGGYAGGANGGMDDRFDFIFVSEDIMSGSGEVNYIDNSYVAEGQDGSYFNQEINYSSNSVVPNNIASALFYMSDHLPVSLQFFVDQTLDIDKNKDNQIEIDFNFSFNSLLIKDVKNFETLKIHDINGRCVIKKQFPNSKYLSIDLSMLKTGFYVLNCRSKNEVFVQKFVNHN